MRTICFPRGGRPSSVGFLIAAGFVAIQPARAQHATENAVTAADDAFGTSLSHDAIGLYDETNVRGFSPTRAGNLRIEGLYFDSEANITWRVVDNETIRVGPSAQGYAFPAPTGVANISLRGSGNAFSVSPIASVDSFGTRSLEVDAQVPLIKDRLSTAVGAGIYRNEYGDGHGLSRWNVGFVPRLKLSSSTEIVGFYTRVQIWDASAQQVYIPTGDFLPDRVKRGTYPGPFWTGSGNYQQTFGAIIRTDIRGWNLRGGLFRSLSKYQENYGNNIFVKSDMTTDRQVDAFPGSTQSSWSGEARASRHFQEGPRKYIITAMIRGRDIYNQYGGSDTVDLGEANLETVVDTPRPAFQLGPLTDNRTHQLTFGLSSSLAWRGLGEVTLGIQRSKYIKEIAQPGIPSEHSVSNTWLPSASGTVPLAEHLLIYGSYVRGLEDAGTAPNYASNPNQILPPINTIQYDAGVKWSPAKDITLLLGWYNIKKPYINLASNGHYGVLGNETHRGVEASLTTKPVSGLTVVAGGILASPKVQAGADIAEPVGQIPVGQYRVSTRLNINYTLPFAKLVTLDAYINHDGATVGTVDNVVKIPADTRIGLGVRYGMLIGERKVVFRILGNYLTNSFRWTPVSSGAYVYSTQRNVSAYITTDF